ncbi:MAG: T9SS type A sorting domain-containing protein, partial [Bacteroidota bacterium]|nr:T9SS type A sorting domain-containing protein [Bacteroidota bacterium]
ATTTPSNYSGNEHIYANEIENSYYAVIAPANIYTTYASGYSNHYQLWKTSITDHTGNSNGAVMAVNAGTTYASIYKRAVPLTAGKTYQFSFWLYVVNPNANLNVNIISPSGNSKVASKSATGTLGTASSAWVQYSVDFNLPTGYTSGTYYLDVSNNLISDSGNDFYIDDLLFQEVTNGNSPVTITNPAPEPIAGADVSSSNTISILTNDKLSNGTTPATKSNSTVKLLVPLRANVSTDGNTVYVHTEGNWVYNNNNGTLTFTPNSGFTGDPTPIEYTITENSTSFTSAPATVTVTYTTHPTAVADTIPVVSGSATTLNILANDKKSNGNTPSASEVTVPLIDKYGIIQTGSSITVIGEGTWAYDSNTGTLTFSPESGFTGCPTPISYKITQSGYSSAPVVVTPFVFSVAAQSTDKSTPTITGSVTKATTDQYSVVVNGITYTYGDGNLTYNRSNNTWALTIPSARALDPGSYTVTAILGNNQTTGALTIVPNSWTGTGTWSTSAYWSTHSTPSTNSTVVVTSGTLTIDQDVTIKELTLNSIANLTLAAGKTLTINGDFIVKGDGSFVDQGGTLTVNGTSKVIKGMVHGKNWYISSPLSAAQSGVTTSLSGTNHLWKYNEPNVAWDEITNATTPFGIMTGYIINTSAIDTVVFTGGTFNTGAYTMNIYRTENGKAKRGFNLVGNPYISSIDWNKATTTNLNLIPTIWYRAKNTSNKYVFDTYNSGVGTNNNGYAAVTNYIPPMQAFWVRVQDGASTGSLSFDNSMRTHSTNNFLRRAQVTDNQILRLQVSNGSSIDQSILVFNPEYSDSIDSSDSPKITNDNAAIPEIYTVAGSEQLVINCMNSSFSSKETPLGFKTGQAGSFTISAPEISNIDPNASIFLYDKQLNTTQDLTNGESYTFTSAIANTTSRFSILMSKVTTGLSLVRNDLAASISEENGKIKVTIKDPSVHKGDISISNTLGQQLTSVATTGETTIVDDALSPGIYLITVKADGKTTTKKLSFK